MKIGVLISIREKSTRFPGKVLKTIGNQTVTEHLIDRLKMANGYDKLIIATSDDERDKVFEKFSKRKNIDIYFGDKEDKLLRYLQVCEYYSLDAVIIVDGDDILCFPEIVSSTIEELKQEEHDVIFWEILPLGAACSGLTKYALEKVMKIKEESDTEVWGGYFNNQNFRVARLKTDNEIYNHQKIRLTLDYQEDFDFLEKIFEYFANNNQFSSDELMKLLIHTKPELNEINAKAQVLYEEHIKKAAPVKIKENIL